MDMAPKMKPHARALLMTIAEAWLVLARAAETTVSVQQTRGMGNNSDRVH